MLTSRGSVRLLLAAVVGASVSGCRDTASTSTNPRASRVGNGHAADPSSPPVASVADRGPIYFSSHRAGSGIDFVHVSGDSSEKPFPAANGSGVAALDYDRDGFCDLYFATGNSFPVARPAERINRLYRNLGEWNFRDSTTASGLGHDGYSAGLAIGDYDSDGFPDVCVTCYGRNALFRNAGDGTFVDVSAISATDDDRWATSAAFLDYDGDGLLDLYVGNYAKWTMETNQFCGDRLHNRRMFCGPTSVPPETDLLYHNSGDGTFHNASIESGIASSGGRAQGVIAADLNQDAWTDLYVTNDQHPNFLFINQKNGTFREEGELSGSAFDRSGKAQAGMGVTVADVDHNGTFDLLVTNFEREHNAFYENHGDGFYHDVSHMRGLAAASLPWIGWGTAFADFDLDGWHDLIVVNGHVDDNLHEFGREGEYAQPALVWRNTGGQFEFLGASAGTYFAGAHPARGLAIADLDNDGDWDVVCGHQDERPEMLCNESASESSQPRSLTVTLIGRASNRDAIGTVVTCSQGDRTQLEQVSGGESYLSSSQRIILVATDREEDDGEVSLKIVWPGGRTSLVNGLYPHGRYNIIEPSASDNDLCRVVRQPHVSLARSAPER